MKTTPKKSSLNQTKIESISSDKALENKQQSNHTESESSFFQNSKAFDSEFNHFISSRPEIERKETVKEQQLFKERLIKKLESAT